MTTINWKIVIEPDSELSKDDTDLLLECISESIQKFKEFEGMVQI